jgi:5-methylcytosine-specific restriction endonuclease McrA
VIDKNSIREIKEKHYSFCKKHLLENIFKTIRKITDKADKARMTRLFEREFYSLIVSKPVDVELERRLVREISSIKGTYPHLTAKGYTQQRNKINITGTFKEVIEKLFLTNYDLFGNKDDCKKYKSPNFTDFTWNSYIFTQLVGITVCPYCNSEFIFTQLEEKKEKEKICGTYIPRITIRPQLDHYISKDKHPLLASSIFNLVPCCKTCNSSLKHNLELNNEDFLNPLEGDIYDNFSFSILNNENVEEDHYSTLTGRNNNFKLTIKPKILSDEEKVEKKYKEAKNTIEFFRIIDRYDPYKNYIEYLISRELLYSKTYNKNLEEAFPKLFNPGEINVIKKNTSNRNNNDFIFSKILNDLLS